MNKKTQLDKLRVSIQTISKVKSAQELIAYSERTGRRKRRKSAIKDAQKEATGLFANASDTPEVLAAEKNNNNVGSALIFSSHEKEVPPEIVARQYALDCLSRREYGTQELLKKMLTKEYDQDICEQVLAELTREDLLSDERFADAMVKHGAFKGQGPRKIRHDLVKKSLDTHYINSAFEACEIDWFELAAEVRLKKFGKIIPAEWKDKAKQMRFMQTRGFELDHINASFKH